MESAAQPATATPADTTEAAGSLRLHELPQDALVQIFKRLDDAHAVPAVCRAFRDICHTRAQRITLASAFQVGNDARLLAIMRASPALKRVTAAAPNLGWPLALLNNITSLHAPLGWPVRDVPTALAELVVTSVRYPVVGSEADARWCAQLLAHLARARSACVVHVRSVIAETDAIVQWIDDATAPRVRVSLLLAQSLPVLQRVAPLAHLLELRELRVWDCGSTTQLDVERGANLSTLSTLVVFNCRHVQSISGLFRGGHGAAVSMPRLARLRLTDCPCFREWDGLALAQPTALKDLILEKCAVESLRPLRWRGAMNVERVRVADCQWLTSLDGLEALPRLRCLEVLGSHRLGQFSDAGLAAIAGLTALTALNLSGSQLATFAGLEGVRFPHLQSLAVASCGITSLEALATCKFPALERLNLRDNGALASLEGLCYAPLLLTLDLGGCGCITMASLQVLSAARMLRLKEVTIGGCVPHGMTKIDIGENSVWVLGPRAAGSKAAAFLVLD